MEEGLRYKRVTEIKSKGYFCALWKEKQKYWIWRKAHRGY